MPLSLGTSNVPTDAASGISSKTGAMGEGSVGGNASGKGSESNAGGREMGDSESSMKGDTVSIVYLLYFLGVGMAWSSVTVFVSFADDVVSWLSPRNFIEPLTSLPSLVRYTISYYLRGGLVCPASYKDLTSIFAICRR